MWRALVLCLLALPAQAGPWPRESGSGLLLAGVEADEGGTWAFAWAEYGTHLGTLTLDLGTKNSLVSPGDRRAAIVLSRPVPAPGVWAAGYEVGLAADLGGDWPRPGLRAGLAFGRSVTSPLGEGWTSLALRAVIGQDWRRVAVSGVLGAHLTDRTTLELRLYAEHEDEVAATAFAVLQREVGPVRLRLGVHHGTAGPALSLGVMREF